MEPNFTCKKYNQYMGSTYYKCSDPDIGSTEQELINIFKHKVYTFYINL